ncbi:unnamed protein product [Nezara viridula]|uniref:Uncharacterized protein n=1 Tax=Nezara viridula TaxID=85310 RepID=A0A9P0MJJ2_NEZVI|nr:unnamed protein product [Nezara viridula]
MILENGKRVYKLFFIFTYQLPASTDDPLFSIGAGNLKVTHLLPSFGPFDEKMSYLEVTGSDTEEGVISRSRKLISEDEEQFVPEKEEVWEMRKMNLLRLSL